MVLFQYSSKRTIFLTLLCVLLVIPNIKALNFLLEQGTEKCFLEEIPQDTVGVIKYSSKEEDAISHRGPKVAGGGGGNNIKFPGVKETSFYIYSPNGDIIITRYAQLEAKVEFTAYQAGEYRICWSSNRTSFAKFFGSKSITEISFNFKTGDAANDYVAIATADDLNNMELNVRKLNDKIRSIISEQNFQRKAEEDFRDVSEYTCSRIVWYSILEIGIVIGSGLWQIYHLKRFFRSKKLV